MEIFRCFSGFFLVLDALVDVLVEDFLSANIQWQSRRYITTPSTFSGIFCSHKATLRRIELIPTIIMLHYSNTMKRRGIGAPPYKLIYAFGSAYYTI